MIKIERTIPDPMCYNPEFQAAGDAREVELCYPRHNRLKYIRVGLSCVRAADDILIGYDFERDGWAIHQQKHIPDPDGHGCETPEPDEWHEVAFVEAWGLEYDSEKKGGGQDD